MQEKQTNKHTIIYNMPPNENHLENALIFSDYHGNSLDRQNSIPVWYKIRNDIPRIV
jgi:hypothetical protein